MMNNYDRIETLAISLVLGMTLFPAPTSAQPAPPPPEDPPLPMTIPQVPQKSYLGIGPALGMSGSSTALSSGGVAIFNKGAIGENLSLRNTNIIFGSRIPTAMMAVALDFPFRDEGSGEIMFSPFIGGGLAIRNNNGTLIDPHVTAGVDLPLPIGATGLLHLDVIFPRDSQAEIGLSFGVGFNL
jgi:hypothetical protein